MALLHLALAPSSLRAATLATATAPHLERRTLQAARLTEATPRIDGTLDDPAWASAPVATDFVENRPVPAALASLVSRARVLVDDEAVYFGLEYDDAEPASIQSPLARRDDETVSDWAFVEIDSRHDRRTAFSFGVNPRGVQVDGVWLADTLYDSNWNAVWSAAAAVGARGWTAEIRIPFSQLAFALPPGTKELVWGINFYRYAPSHAESSNWSPRYAGLAGVVSNFNDLVVPAPPRVHRLEATPYAAAQGGNAADGERQTRAGADLAVGIGPSFRLTATVLPDFGQVEADPSQVNLSAFELFQAERRPFFLEGLDLFRFDTSLAFSARDASFADEAPFYSRRVGAAPPGSVPAELEVLERPGATSLLGAAKLVGDTTNGWTLGAFASASDSESALVRTPAGERLRFRIAPRSTLAVARAQHSSRDASTAIGFFAERLDRTAMTERLARELARDTTTLGVDLRQIFADGVYELRAWALATEVHGTAEAIRAVANSPRHLFQRPDGPRGLDADAQRLNGGAGEARFARLGGSFRWSLTARGISRGYDIDATGYQQTSDWLLLAGTWRYERFPTGTKLRTWAIGSDSSGVGYTTGGERRAGVVGLYGFAETHGTASAKLTLTHDVEALAIGWLRGGPALLLPPRDTLALNLVSSGTSPTYASLDAVAAHEPGSDSWALSASPFVNVRSSHRLQWSVGPTFRADAIGWQPVGQPTVDGATHDVVARVLQRTVALTLRAEYIFNPRLSVQVYAQPFATVGRYSRYQVLRAPRAAAADERFAPLCDPCAVDPDGNVPLDLDGDGVRETRLPARDGVVRSLNASAVVRWEMRPGSFLTVVWNQQRAAVTREALRTPLGALGDLGADASTNVVLAKIGWRLGR